MQFGSKLLCLRSSQYDLEWGVFQDSRSHLPENRQISRHIHLLKVQDMLPWKEQIANRKRAN